MVLGAKTIENNALAGLSRQAGPVVTAAIRKASTATGVNFSYLMENAAAESSFDTDAKARTSSARGLYQFIERTWMQMIKEHGAAYGLGNYADKISGNYTVSSKAMRQEILNLRNDPQISAYMAAEFAADNKAYMERGLGSSYGDIGSTELYFAHFLGAGQATAFLKAMKSNPVANAADLFPQAARANRAVFYDQKTGAPRSLSQVYAFFDNKFSDDSSIADAATRSNRLAPAPGRKPEQFEPLDANGDGLRIKPEAEDFIAPRRLSFVDAERSAGLSRMDREMDAATLNMMSDDNPISATTLVADPVSIMLMAQMTAPERATRSENEDRRADSIPRPARKPLRETDTAENIMRPRQVMRFNS